MIWICFCGRRSQVALSYVDGYFLYLDAGQFNKISIFNLAIPILKLHLYFQIFSPFSQYIALLSIDKKQYWTKRLKNIILQMHSHALESSIKSKFGMNKCLDFFSVRASLDPIYRQTFFLHFATRKRRWPPHQLWGAKIPYTDCRQTNAKLSVLCSKIIF